MPIPIYSGNIFFTETSFYDWFYCIGTRTGADLRHIIGAKRNYISASVSSEQVLSEAEKDYVNQTEID